jgi:hypothetical protein
MTMGLQTRRAIAGTVAGLLYGCVLAFLTIFAAGGGHGTNIPLFLSSAPLCPLLWAVRGTGAGSDWALYAVLYGPAFVWAVLGLLVALGGRWMRLAASLLLLHYLSGLALVVATGGELRGLNGRVPEGFIAWAPVYLLGQAAVWWRLVRGNRIRSSG